jgi:hypothetical protein
MDTYQSSEKLILLATGSPEDRAERDSAQKSRVRPLNLIRIMPAEEECAIRPPAIRAAFFMSVEPVRNWFQVSVFRFQLCQF